MSRQIFANGENNYVFNYNSQISKSPCKATYPQDLEGLLADLHSARLEDLDASQILDREGAGGRSHGLLVGLPLVRLGGLGDAVLATPEGIAEGAAQTIHFLGGFLAKPEGGGFLEGIQEAL